MKKLLVLSALFLSFAAFAQVPQGISYQAIAANSSGAPVVNSNVSVRLSVLDNAATGTLLYAETQTKTTNAQGLFNLVIGQGTVGAGTFAGINWRVNPKFLKVEMDITGGANYVLVGTTQLLSVPYALAADSLVTSAGEGITLVSPNGTPYTITVNDAGQLSLPTSGTGSNIPDTLYMYGSFNSYDANTALLMASVPVFSGVARYGYKYLTSGSTIKFLSSNTAGAGIYGVNASSLLALNASAYTVASTGFYYFNITHSAMDPNPVMYFTNSSIVPTMTVISVDNPNTTISNPTYNAGTNTFTFIANGITTSNNTFGFNFSTPEGEYFGDNLADGQIDYGGTPISFPNTTATPKNFRVTLNINFNGSGTYTVVQI